MSSPPQGKDSTLPALPGFWWFYRPKLSDLVRGWWWAANFHNDFVGAVLLTGAVVLTLAWWTDALSTLGEHASALAPWLPRLSSWFLVVLFIYAFLRVNYQRFVALDAVITADSERRMQDALSAKQRQLVEWTLERDTTMSRVTADWAARVTQLEREIAERDEGISHLQRQLAPFIELQPLVIEGVVRHENFWHLIVRNPNPRPVKGCYASLIRVTKVQARPPDAPLPTEGFRFPLGSHTGSALVFPISPHEPAHVNLVALEPNRAFGSMYFVSISYAKAGPPLTLLFPQDRGWFHLDLVVGSVEEKLDPAYARVDLIYEPTNGDLTAELILEETGNRDDDTYEELPF